MDPAVNSFNTATTSPCYKWTITFYVKDVPEPGAFAFQFKVFYDPTWLNVTAAALPASTDTEYLFFGSSTVRPAPSIDPIGGSVLVGDSILAGTPASGAGPFKLGTVEFHIIRAPGKYEELTSALDIDNVDTYLLNEALGEITPIIKSSGSATYTWSPPATIPTVAIVPNYVLFDQYTNATDPANSDFDVEVRIQNLEVGWALHNASITVNYNTPDAILDLLGVIVDPAWAGPNNVGVVPGTISIFVQGHPAPAGDVLVATISFRVNSQGENPPDTTSLFSDLTLSDIILWDTVGTIDYYFDHGLVEVEPYLALPLPHFEVDSVTLGPELVICDQFGIEFDVNVYIKNLHFAWQMVGFNLRVSYDPSLLNVVDVTEGPFMQDPTWNWYGTYPIVLYPEPPNPWCPETHLILADLILPNAVGEWDQPSPEGDGIVFTIRFEPLKQSWTDTYTVNLDIYPMFPPGAYMVDEAGNDIPVDEVANVDGVVTILPIDPVGRRIDVWFVSPDIGGGGVGQYAGLVLPQSEVCLTAKVTYNWWHVQYKKVTFEVRDNTGTLWAILQDDTDDEGHAYACFRMPWPCEGAEDLLGKWTVTVSVTLADVVISDTVEYDYDYLIRIWKVTTDKPEYVHCEWVQITVEYGTKSMLERDVVLAVTVTDELGVPIGVVLVEMTVGGADYCTYKNYTTTVEIHVIKWAYAGLACAHASFMNALPSQGGEAVAQEVSTCFWILPC
jgi:hypothetical protein